MISVIWFHNNAHASAFLSDLKIDLSLEIGDKENDFNDMLDVIQKGRFVTYQIHIKNNGTVTYHDLVALMDSPDYMKYVPASAYKKDSASATPVLIEDINNVSPLEIGYAIDSLEPGSEIFLKAEYQVNKDILDDTVFTVAWANLMDKYSAIPLVSNLIESKISGDAAPALQVTVDTLPIPGSKVGPGFQISYTYTIKNFGGVPETGVGLITYLPEHTTCISSCGTIEFGVLNPNEFVTAVMIVQVNTDYGGASKIENIGFNYFGKITGTIEPGTAGDVTITTEAKDLDAFMAKPEAKDLFKLLIVLKKVE